MYIELSKNILLICLTIGFLYLFFNQKNSIEKFTDTSLNEAITNLATISKNIISDDILDLTLAKKVNIQNLDVTSLNILPRGSIIAFNSKDAPNGWVLCDGSRLSDGTIVPDLRGRFILGYGSGIGLTSNVFKTTGGEEHHQLTTAELPSHDHQYNDSTSYAARAVDGSCWDCHLGGGYHTGSRTITTGTKGSNQAHNNMPPYYVLTYIMKL